MALIFKCAYNNVILLDQDQGRQGCYNIVIVLDQDKGRQGWYRYGNINFIEISYQCDFSISPTSVLEEDLEAMVIHDDTTAIEFHRNVSDLSISSEGAFEEELEALVVHDYTTAIVLHSNVSNIFKLLKQYNIPRTQKYLVTKYIVFNKFIPIYSVKWHNRWFIFGYQMETGSYEQCQMEGDSYEQPIAPDTERFQQATNMQEGKSINLLSSFSFKFPHMLFSDSFILNRSKHAIEYSRKLMTEIFDKAEISMMPLNLQGEIQQQVSKYFVSQFKRHYWNYNLKYSHNKKRIRNTHVLKAVDKMLWNRQLINHFTSVLRKTHLHCNGILNTFNFTFVWIGDLLEHIHHPYQAKLKIFHIRMNSKKEKNLENKHTSVCFIYIMGTIQ